MTANGEKLIFGDLTARIIGSFFRVYNALGYGFLESVYAAALSLDLRNQGLRVEREVPVEVYYLGQPIARYRVDMLVEQKVLIEIKSCAQVGMTERRQVYNYLRSTRIQLALLLHFGPDPKYYRVISTDKSFLLA
jgi:GxxExxY protein